LTARAAATAPGAPLNLNSTVQGGTVTLTWGAPGGADPATSYFLEAGASSRAANLAAFSTGTSATSYVAQGVAPGTYYVRVRGENAGGRSETSNEVVVTVGSTGCVGAPSAPTNLVGSAAGNTVTLNWTAPSTGCPATSYVLQAGTTSGSSALANSNTGSSSTTYVAT